MRWFWPRSNWWLALLVVAIVAAAGAMGDLAPFDNNVYAWGMRFSASREPSDRILVVSVDPAVAASPDKLNQTLTGVTERLDAAGAGVIGFVLPPDQLAAAGDFGNATGASPPVDSAGTEATFLASIAAAHNVVLAATVSGVADANSASGVAVELPDSIALNSLPRFSDPPTEPLLAQFLTTRALRVQLNVPPAPLASAAVGVGVLTDSSDLTGAEPAVLQTGDAYVPDFAVEVAARALNLNNLDITGGQRRAVQLGSRTLPTDQRLRLYPYFYSGDLAAFPVYPASAVVDGTLPEGTFRNKIVLVGVTAKEAVTGQAMPLGGVMTPVIFQANVISSIMKGSLYAVPAWGIWLSAGLLLLIALYFVLIVPRVRYPTAVAISVVFALLLLNAELLLIIGDSLWLPLAAPIVALVFTHIVLGFKRFLDLRVERFQTDLSETNRLLGQSYQEQGQLDLALERYRHCLPSVKLAADYYDLGLSYESKRQFAKAATSFRAVRKIDPEYLDINRRLKRLEDIENRMVLGGTATQPVEGLIIDSDGLSKPMLGRYSIEEQIGRGSMGIVYLGKDPRIGRTVAIKTMTLARDDADVDIAEISRRFFREAKAAGRLSHPNIVTIYDVGEDHGVAYIAMDYLYGEDLKSRCNKDNLLSFGEIMKIGSRVADALDYAHTNQVVHRDIKPGNIVYETESGRVKVTDFGVAFLGDATATRSALVLGSPSYMSPEQVQGKPLDGRTDIFSLGVTLFQLATGQLPFNGQPIATMMYRIATEPHPSVQSVRDDVPTCLARIIDKALQKKPEDRYQTGAAMARELRLCLSSWRKTTAVRTVEAENRAS
ncbi:MAG TPA: protein kinase [Gammaproteobacteria bacterium]|nr:protein kinase [Gammaproteobacteria bacterium]